MYHTVLQYIMQYSTTMVHNVPQCTIPYHMVHAIQYPAIQCHALLVHPPLSLTTRYPAPLPPPLPQGLESRVVLIHMNHSNPLHDPKSSQRAWVQGLGFTLGAQGASWQL